MSVAHPQLSTLVCSIFANAPMRRWILIRCYPHCRPTDHVKKKMIYISDILPKGGLSIVDCGSIPGIGRGGSRKKHSNVQCGRREANVSISAPVITRPPPVQPDGDYRYVMRKITTTTTTTVPCLIGSHHISSLFLPFFTGVHFKANQYSLFVAFLPPLSLQVKLALILDAS